MAACLLTGERGYLGSAVAAELRAQGLAWTAVPGRIEQLAPGSLAAMTQPGTPITLIHCAGALRHQPERLQRDNVQASAALAAALPPDARVLFASSRSVYGAPAGHWCHETDATTPVDDYGRSKLAAERALLARAVPGLAVRLSTLFGAAPSGDCPSLPNQALRRWCQHEAVHLLREDMPVDYLAVQDAAVALVALARMPEWPDTAVNLPGPQRGLHVLFEGLAAAARARGLTARIAFDHPGTPRWPGQHGQRLQRWLPGFQYRADGDVAADWLSRAASSAT